MPLQRLLSIVSAWSPPTPPFWCGEATHTGWGTDSPLASSSFSQRGDSKDCILSLRSVCHYRRTAVQAGVQTSGLSYPLLTYQSSRMMVWFMRSTSSVGLGVIRRGSELVHTIQLTEVCNKMACKGLPLITD